MFMTESSIFKPSWYSNLRRSFPMSHSGHEAHFDQTSLSHNELYPIALYLSKVILLQVQTSCPDSSISRSTVPNPPSSEICTSLYAFFEAATLGDG